MIKKILFSLIFLHSAAQTADFTTYHEDFSRSVSGSFALHQTDFLSVKTLGERAELTIKAKGSYGATRPLVHFSLNHLAGCASTVKRNIIIVTKLSNIGMIPFNFTPEDTCYWGDVTLNPKNTKVFLTPEVVWEAEANYTVLKEHGYQFIVIDNPKDAASQFLLENGIADPYYDSDNTPIIFPQYGVNDFVFPTLHK